MKRLVLISGISGAGKSTASNMLEDMGFTCIDQYPAELLPDLLELIKTDESFRYDKVALTIVISDLERFYNLLSNSEYKPDLILLDANKDIIINRYKFTRRVHPLVLSNTASIVIDTTTLSTKNLKAILDKRLNFDDFENLAITFESFGFKNGVPDDADMVLDVRVLDNPFYVAELKDLTGNDAPVRDFVLNSKLTKRYLKKTVDLLDLMFKSYDNEEKRHLTICVGCTGGQHRSVTIANYLYEHYKEKYLCYIAHREQEK